MFYNLNFLTEFDYNQYLTIRNHYKIRTQCLLFELHSCIRA